MAARRWPHFLGLDDSRGLRVVVVVVMVVEGVVLGVVGVGLGIVGVQRVSLNTIGLNEVVDEVTVGVTVAMARGVTSKMNSASGSKELS